MATFYKGDEIKFVIDLQAPGFSMDDDDFEIEVASRRNSVKGYKDATKAADTDVVIFKETSDEEGAPSTWYGIVDTKNLATGDLRVIATAYVKDTNANDNVRTNIAVAQLCRLENP